MSRVGLVLRSMYTPVRGFLSRSTPKLTEGASQGPTPIVQPSDVDEQIESGKIRRQSHGHRRVSLLGDLSACPESNMRVGMIMRGWSVVRSRLSTRMSRLNIVTLGRTRHLTTHAVVNRLRGAADLHVLTAGRGLVHRLPVPRTRWWAWLASDFPSGTRRSQQRARKRARARSACRLQQPGSSQEAAGT